MPAKTNPLRANRARAPETLPAAAGAYELEILLSRAATIRAGALGVRRLRAGRYVYVGSARGGLRRRVERHLRLAESKAGGGRWHIDALLRLSHARVAAVRAYRGRAECDLAREIAARPGARAPIARFGATDCRARCPAHLFLLNPRKAPQRPGGLRRDGVIESKARR